MTLQHELRKRGPFESPQQEATLALMRTSDLVENRLARLLREHNLTLSQYNVLRILRGEGQPMACLEIAERMVQVAPAITRVIDQLLALKLISKTQSSTDRRVFAVALLPAARQLLARLDQPVLDLHAALFEGVPLSEVRQLVQILERVRAAIGT